MYSLRVVAARSVVQLICPPTLSAEDDADHAVPFHMR